MIADCGSYLAIFMPRGIIRHADVALPRYPVEVQDNMRFSLRSLFLLMSTLAIIAGIFALSEEVGGYIFLIATSTLGSFAGRSHLAKSVAMSSLGGVTAMLILLFCHAVRAGFPVNDYYASGLFLGVALAFAAFGAFVGFLEYFFWKLERKPMEAEEFLAAARVYGGIIGSVSLTFAIYRIHHTHFGEPVSQLAWHEVWTALFILLTLILGFLVGVVIGVVSGTCLSVLRQRWIESESRKAAERASVVVQKNPF